jgi:hypothetical protein
MQMIPKIFLTGDPEKWSVQEVSPKLQLASSVWVR